MTAVTAVINISDGWFALGMFAFLFAVLGLDALVQDHRARRSQQRVSQLRRRQIDTVCTRDQVGNRSRRHG